MPNSLWYIALQLAERAIKMSLTEIELSRLKAAIATALLSQRLNSWQTKFVTDMKIKLTRYGTKTKLSEKQQSKLYETLKPYLEQSTVVQFSKAPLKPKRARPSPRSNHRPSRAPRKNRRARKRLFVSRKLMLLALGFLIVIGIFQSDNAPSGRDTGLTPELGTHQLSLRDFSVVDGDTIKLRGDRSGTRLVGFNTPEVFSPRCDAGLALGNRATDRLKDLVRDANRIELELVACACPPSTQGTDRCNFGRRCGVLSVDGIDVARTLISEGLAASFVCGSASCPPTPRPWCN